MRLDRLGTAAPAGPLGRLDPRLALGATLAFVVAVVATPLGSWRGLAAEGLVLSFVLGLSGVPPRAVGRRWLGLLALVGPLAGLVAATHPLRGELGWAGVAGAIVAKNGLALGAVLVLSGVVPLPRLLDALGRLGAPAVLVATLLLMARYLHVLSDELGRMALARRARSFRRSGRLGWILLSGLIGVLFLRGFERAERVHAAMLARGWDGTVRTLDGPDRP